MRTRKPKKPRRGPGERPDAAAKAEVRKEEIKLESDEQSRADDEGMPAADVEIKPR